MSSDGSKARGGNCDTRLKKYAIAFGIINTLILGIGMCFTMVLGNQFFYQGIVIGIIGIIGISLALPLYD